MAGTEGLIPGAILGVAFQQLWNTIKEVNAANNHFKPNLDRLENRIKLLAPKIKEMDRLNQELQDKDVNTNEEIQMFHDLLEKARGLVSMCALVNHRNFFKKHKYSKRLVELDLSFEKLLNVEFQAAQALDIKRVMADVLKMKKKLDAIDLTEAAAAPNDDINNFNSPLRKGVDFFFTWEDKKYGLRIGSWKVET